ncbi:MAG TPA: T9SS type A sorting domain-containing protein [Candidatus Kapabacteria bacterium]|jgi:photosystem II stability/assembly factor-like uncharacterized protein|nr:T9SS type A sorting domain-containing protein [Candidatus Kapabacteria bacterium]
MKINQITKFLYIAILIVFTTFSASAQWQSCTPLYGGYYFSLLQVSDTIIIAGSGGYGTFRSTDNGRTWNRVINSKDGLAITQSGTSLYVANEEGVYRSMDSGATWTKTQQEGLPKNLTITTVKAVDNQLFLGAIEGAYRSQDGGATWSQLTTIGDKEVWSFLSDNGKIYAGTGGQGLYLSTDNGNTWNFAGMDGMTIFSLYMHDARIIAGTNDGIFMSENGGNWILSGLTGLSIAAIHYHNSKYLAGTSTGIYYSDDGGKTWGNTELEGYSITSFAISNSVLFTSTNNGIFKNDNGKWLITGAHSFGNSVSSMTTLNGRIFAGTQRGLYISDNGGINWNTVQYDGNSITTIQAFGNTLLFGTDKGRSFRSDDNGNTWSALRLLPLAGYIYTFAVRDNWVIVGTNAGIFRSSTNGQIWEQSNTPANLKSCRTIIYDNDILYAGANNGVYSSTDNGGSWQLRAAIQTEVRSMKKIENRFYAGTSGNGLFFSDDGTQWDKITNGFPGSTVNALSSLPQGLFVAASEGLFYRDNQGMKWKTVSTPYITIQDFTVLNDSLLYITNGQNISFASLQAITDNTVGISTNASLEGLSLSITPHPVISEGKIVFSGDQSLLLALEVYNVQGEMIYKHIPNDSMDNTQSIKLPPLSSGLYIVKAHTQNGIVTLPFIAQ